MADMLKSAQELIFKQNMKEGHFYVILAKMSPSTFYILLKSTLLQTLLHCGTEEVAI